MRLDIDELLDDLTLEEAAMITASVEDVIIDEEIKNRLSTKALSKAQIDTEKVYRMPKKKSSNRWTKIAASIVAILIIGSSTAYAAGMLAGVTKNFTGEVSAFQQELSKTVHDASNSKYKVSVEGAIADKNQCKFALRIKDISLKAKLNITKDSSPDFTKAEIYAKLKDSTEKKLDGLSTESREKDGSACIITVMKEDFDVESMEQVESLQIYYEDIKLTTEVVMLGETISLQPKEKTNIKQVEMSSIGYSYVAENSDQEVKWIKNDGTVEEIELFSQIAVEVKDEIHVAGDYSCKIINLEEYQGLQIDGVKYYRK